MRKLAWMLLILFILFVVFLTLAITDYNGIGTWASQTFEGSVAGPIGGWVKDTWIAVGANGYQILIVTILISVVGAFFWVPVMYGLFWQKLVMQKIMHRQPTTPVNRQSEPTTTLPITGLQTEPTKTETVSGETQQ